MQDCPHTAGKENGEIRMDELAAFSGKVSLPLRTADTGHRLGTDTGHSWTLFDFRQQCRWREYTARRTREQEKC